MLAVAAAAAVILPKAFAGSEAPTAAAVTAANHGMTLSTTSPRLIADLDAALPRPSVKAVLDSANRTGTSCTAPAKNRVSSFCWQSGDAKTADWIPQGITTSADANGGTYDGRKVLLVSWYTDSAKGVRVTFADLASRTTPKYRHVLLVEPATVNGTSSFKPVDVHAGGIAWYGNLLYVTGTTTGLRVFDMRHLWKTSTADAATIGRQADGSYQAYGYQYVLPQVAHWASRDEMWSLTEYAGKRYVYALRASKL